LWRYHCLLADARALLKALLRVAKVVVTRNLCPNVHKVDRIDKDHKDKVAQKSHVKPELEQTHKDYVILVDSASPNAMSNSRKKRSTNRFQGRASSENVEDYQNPGV
jgi:hypothetical protein